MKIKNWLMAIGMAVVALSFVSCSKEGGSNGKNEIVGDWEYTMTKYFIDGKEIVLEDGQYLFLYKDNETSANAYNYLEYYWEGAHDGFSIPLSFYNNGKMTYGSLNCTYTINGNKILINSYGEDVEFYIEGNYIMNYYEDISITGYIIANEGNFEEEDIVEKHLDGVNRIFNEAECFSKVN